MSADGKWKATINSPMGAQNADVTIKTSGSTFSGTLQSPMGTQEISGNVDGDTLTWQSSITQPMPLTLDFTVKFEGDNLNGTVKLGSFGTAPITGKRAA